MESQKHLMDRRDFLSKSSQAALFALSSGSLLAASGSFVHAKSSDKNNLNTITNERKFSLEKRRLGSLEVSEMGSKYSDAQLKLLSKIPLLLVYGDYLVNDTEVECHNGKSSFAS